MLSVAKFRSLRAVLSLQTLLLAVCIAPSGAVAAEDFGPLLNVKDLKAYSESSNLSILDIRTDKKGDVPIFEAAHIPGAIHAPYDLFRGPRSNPGELKPVAELTALFRSFGLEIDQPIVIVHQGKNATDFGGAARVYWTLKSSGFQQIAILNGGVNAWHKAGYPLEAGSGQAVWPSEVSITFSNQWLATTQDVEAYVAGTKSGELIDARPKEFWEGNRKHALADRPGTLPQSRYFVQSSWFDTDAPAILQTSLVAQQVKKGGFQPDDKLVSFCNTGHWAATNWFVLNELAGLKDVKLYAESLVGWSQAGGKMDNVPSVFRNLWNKVNGHY